MRSTILQTATRFLMPLLLLFALFLLLRGHNEPGGGFVGGLVVASSFVLYGMAFGVDRARRALLVDPSTLLSGGLLVALSSGIPALLLGRPFMTALWTKVGVEPGGPRRWHPAHLRRRRLSGGHRSGPHHRLHIGRRESERGMTWNCCWPSSPVCSMRRASI